MGKGNVDGLLKYFIIMRQSKRDVTAEVAAESAAAAAGDQHYHGKHIMCTYFGVLFHTPCICIVTHSKPIVYF